MCWISDTEPIKKIAKKDIICYKVFHINDIIYKQNYFLGFKFGKRKIQKLYSLYMQHAYIPYKKQEYINLKIYKIFQYYRMSLGYHSYDTLERAKIGIYDLDYKIIKCIIPKNSEYYVNSNQEIISSSIIITDKILNY